MIHAAAQEVRRALAPALLGAAALAGLRVAADLGLRVNTSASLPRGLYRLAGRPLARSSLVLLCPPRAAARLARERGYLPAGDCPGGVQPLGKMLLALPGDTVELSSRGLAVNGLPIPGSRPSAVDSAGRPLPTAPAGPHRVARGEVWVYAPHPRSFDSRTFGPLPGRQLIGVLAPLWTARSRQLEATAALLRSLGPPP